MQRDNWGGEGGGGGYGRNDRDGGYEQRSGQGGGYGERSQKRPGGGYGEPSQMRVEPTQDIGGAGGGQANVWKTSNFLDALSAPAASEDPVWKPEPGNPETRNLETQKLEATWHVRRGRRLQAGGGSLSWALNPTFYTLNPTPYTLNPGP